MKTKKEIIAQIKKDQEATKSYLKSGAKVKHTDDCKELQPMVGKDEGYVCICEGGKNPQVSGAEGDHTPTTKVTFDGCGINDTDEYASRLATFTERGRPYGEAIVRAVNEFEKNQSVIGKLTAEVDRLQESHEKLLKLARELRAICFKNGSDFKGIDETIAKAEGK